MQTLKLESKTSKAVILKSQKSQKSPVHSNYAMSRVRDRSANQFRSENIKDGTENEKGLSENTPDVNTPNNLKRAAFDLKINSFQASGKPTGR